MSLMMSVTEREKFLADTHIGVLGVASSSPAAPVLVPIWYSYQCGGDIVILTNRSSAKARLIQAAGRFSLCVQQEAPPYRYVSVEGPVVSFEDRVLSEERHAMAHRYLPAETARAYLSATTDQLSTDMTLRMRPERWRTADFSSYAADFS